MNFDKSEHSIVWHKNPGNYLLNDQNVHLWLATQNIENDYIASLYAILSNDEKERANRFYFEKDRNSYIVSRALLRILIGKYLNQKPDSIIFKYAKYDKPYISEHLNYLNLQFNVSHSHGKVLIGFTKIRNIGVDIELVRTLEGAADIVNRNFSQYERHIYNSLPKSLQDRAFFNCWTRKEAFIKAIGKGLTYPLDAFTVSIAPMEEARLLDVKNDSQEKEKWILKDIGINADYVAAMVIESGECQLACYKWEW